MVVCEQEHHALEGTDLISWMAWTWPTACFFGFILLCLIVMSVWEYAAPGGGARHGILGLDTTRGDRLFISAKTVEHHMARMRQRLGATSRSDLLAQLRAITSDHG